jgi:hypothetical protein
MLHQGHPGLWHRLSGLTMVSSSLSLTTAALRFSASGHGGADGGGGDV